MSYGGRVNYLTGNTLSDEWYTPVEIVKKCNQVAKEMGLTETSKVIYPYDTENSIFVKQNKNKDSIHSITDFLDSTYDYDFLITNPPFSKKEKIFEKCLINKKPFVLVMPQTFIFSVGFYNLIKKYKVNYKIHSPKQRIYFIDQNGNQNRPNFHSVILSVSNKYEYNEIIHFE